MKIYLAGPMTGLPEKNSPLFNSEATRLRRLGYEVINPVELNTERLGKSRAACMREDIKAIFEVDAVALLPGWANSKGATCEKHVAEQLDLPIFYAEWITESLK